MNKETKEKLFNDFEEVRKSSGLTFADIADVLGQNSIEYVGEYGIMHPHFDHIVLWPSISVEVAELVNEYIRKYHLYH